MTSPLSLFGFTSALDTHRRLLAMMGSKSSLSESVSSYLRAGTPVVALMEASRCALEPDILVPGGSSLLTDGRWHWRADTAHYVAEHRIALPLTFLDFVERSDYRGGGLPTAMVAEIERALWPPPRRLVNVLTAGPKTAPFQIQVTNPTQSEMLSIWEKTEEVVTLSCPDTLIRLERNDATLLIEHDDEQVFEQISEDNGLDVLEYALGTDTLSLETLVRLASVER